MDHELQWGVRVMSAAADNELVLVCTSRDNAEGTIEGMRHRHPEDTCKLISRVIAYGTWEVEEE